MRGGAWFHFRGGGLWASCLRPQTQLRKRPGGDKPKVVFCTTENDVAHIREAISAGADEYVMKPFDHETLQIKLQLVGFA